MKFDLHLCNFVIKFQKGAPTSFICSIFCGHIPLRPLPYVAGTLLCPGVLGFCWTLLNFLFSAPTFLLEQSDSISFTG